MAAKDKIALNVGGTLYCRDGGESEQAALQRLRQKTWKTGHDLHLIKLVPRSDVGGDGIAVVPPQVVPPPVVPPVVPPVDPLVEPPLVPPIVPPPPPPLVIRQSLGAKTGVNLLSDLEKWGYADGQKVTQASLTISDLSIKELRDLCTKLPPKIRAELQITLPPEEGQK